MAELFLLEVRVWGTFSILILWARIYQACSELKGDVVFFSPSESLARFCSAIFMLLKHDTQLSCSENCLEASHPPTDKEQGKVLFCFVFWVKIFHGILGVQEVLLCHSGALSFLQHFRRCVDCAVWQTSVWISLFWAAFVGSEVKHFTFECLCSSFMNGTALQVHSAGCSWCLWS